MIKRLLAALLITAAAVCVCPGESGEVCAAEKESAVSTEQNYLASTGDQTDRTAEIQAMLERGICCLGPGDFYVSGLALPENARLAGSGYSTRIILNPWIVFGSALELNSGCSVSNLSLVGSPFSISAGSRVGFRHGILFSGHADQKSGKNPSRVTLDHLMVSGFKGGGITLHNTGYGAANSMLVDDVYIHHCGAGVNIDYISEYSSFNNVSVMDCQYGCICNGGNNKFSNCSFTRNAVNVKMDNRDTKRKNPGHGVFSCCSFNHSGSDNDGIAIEIRGNKYGELFDACQIHYGKVIIDSSKGILFNGCEFGRDIDIQVTNSKGTAFNDSSVLDANRISVSVISSPSTRFENCFTLDGEAWEP